MPLSKDDQRTLKAIVKLLPRDPTTLVGTVMRRINDVSLDKYASVYNLWAKEQGFSQVTIIPYYSNLNTMAILLEDAFTREYLNPSRNVKFKRQDYLNATSRKNEDIISIFKNLKGAKDIFVKAVNLCFAYGYDPLFLSQKEQKSRSLLDIISPRDYALISLVAGALANNPDLYEFFENFEGDKISDAQFDAIKKKSVKDDLEKFAKFGILFGKNIYLDRFPVKWINELMSKVDNADLELLKRGLPPERSTKGYKFNTPATGLNAIDRWALIEKRYFDGAEVASGIENVRLKKIFPDNLRAYGFDQGYVDYALEKLDTRASFDTIKQRFLPFTKEEDLYIALPIILAGALEIERYGDPKIEAISVEKLDGTFADVPRKGWRSLLDLIVEEEIQVTLEFKNGKILFKENQTPEPIPVRRDSYQMIRPEVAIVPYGILHSETELDLDATNNENQNPLDLLEKPIAGLLTALAKLENLPVPDLVAARGALIGQIEEIYQDYGAVSIVRIIRNRITFPSKIEEPEAEPNKNPGFNDDQITELAQLLQGLTIRIKDLVKGQRIHLEAHYHNDPTAELIVPEKSLSPAKQPLKPHQISDAIEAIRELMVDEKKISLSSVDKYIQRSNTLWPSQKASKLLHPYPEKRQHATNRDIDALMEVLGLIEANALLLVKENRVFNIVNGPNYSRLNIFDGAINLEGPTKFNLQLDEDTGRIIIIATPEGKEPIVITPQQDANVRRIEGLLKSVSNPPSSGGRLEM